jgi:hypothetical protein
MPSRRAPAAGRLSQAGSCSGSGAAFARREFTAGSSLLRWRRRRGSGRATCRPSRMRASSSSRARSTPKGFFAPTPTTSASRASSSSTNTTLASVTRGLRRHLPSSRYDLGGRGATGLPQPSSSLYLPARSGRRFCPSHPAHREIDHTPRQPSGETRGRDPRPPRHPRALLALGSPAERVGEKPLRGRA